jgi:hypothetical protein
METTELSIYQKGEITLAEIQEKAKTLQITDESLGYWAESMAIARKLATSLDAERKREKEEPLLKCQEIDARYGALIKPCQELGVKIENTIAAFNRAKKEEAERKQREYERQVREAEEARLAEERRKKEEYERELAEAKKKQEEQAKEAEKKGVEPFPPAEIPKPPEPVVPVYVAPPPPIEPPKAKIATTLGSVKIKERWTYEVVDFNLVPREYMMVDQRGVIGAINAKIGFVRTIPGLRIFPEE